MKRTKKILHLLFWLPIAAALIVVAVFETNVILPGTLTGNEETEYYVTMALELLTVAGLPLSLRLFKFPAVIRNLQADKSRYTGFASIRLCVVSGLMLANTFLYYLFMQTTFGYLAIICLITMAFVFPSERRCQTESSELQL